VVTFDFRRSCSFAEVDVDTRNRKVSLRLEAADERKGPWRVMLERPLANCPDLPFHRLPLPAGQKGRYLRLTAEAGGGATWLEEVLVWGDAGVSTESPEAFRPVTPPPIVAEIAFQSFPGIDKTAFSDGIFWEWKRTLGPLAKLPAVWSRVPTWDSITDRPLLPKPEELCREVEVVVARNETESIALALSNVSWEKPWETTVTLSPFVTSAGTPAPGLSSLLHVAGTMGSRYYGVNIGPLFTADNLLPAGLMQRYLTNGSGIRSFPDLVLSRAGSALLWINVTTAGADPGEYTARLSARDGPDVVLKVRVLDVVLPEPRVWLQTWSGGTTMFPFRYVDRDAREVAYKLSLGVTVWDGFPEPGTLAQLGRRPGRSFFHVQGIGDYRDRLYNRQIDAAKITADDEAAIAGTIGEHVKHARSLGLSYDDWYVELTDEPGEGNAAAFGAIIGIIRRTDPKVRIYCNPSFWAGSGCLPDASVAAALSPWYEEGVDISSPLHMLLEDRPACQPLFDAPRLVRAFYQVSTQSAKGEGSDLVNLYREMAWRAFRRGWNGWGFYAYYSPRGNPWNDFDAEWYTGEDLPDYVMVYPGPRGPVATRQSEAVREGWEDYCLLTLLRSRGKDREIDGFLADQAAGMPLSALRLRALQAAAEK